VQVGLCRCGLVAYVRMGYGDKNIKVCICFGTLPGHMHVLRVLQRKECNKFVANKSAEKTKWSGFFLWTWEKFKMMMISFIQQK